jgi:hypothetical protein
MCLTCEERARLRQEALNRQINSYKNNINNQNTSQNNNSRTVTYKSNGTVRYTKQVKR